MPSRKSIPHSLDFAIRFVATGILIVILINRSGNVRSSFAQRDSIAYWATAQLLTHGENPYDVNAITRLETEQGYIGRALVLRTPPWSLFIVSFFGFFNLYWASVLWLAILFAALFFSMRICIEILAVPVQSRSTCQLIGYTFAPILASLYAGQMGLLMLLGLALFLRFHVGRPILSGAVLLLPLAKPHISLLFWVALALWVVTEKRKAVAVGFGVAFGAATLFALVLDPAVFRHYFSALETESIGRLFIPALSGVLRLLFFRQQYWVQFIPMGVGLVWLARFWFVNRSKWNWSDHGLTTLIVSILVTPYGWISDEVIVLPAILYAATFLFMRNAALGIGTMLTVAMFASLNGLLLLLLISNVPFPTGVYFWSSLVWFGWYFYGRHRLRRIAIHPSRAPLGRPRAHIT